MAAGIPGQEERKIVFNSQMPIKKRASWLVFCLHIFKLLLLFLGQLAGNQVILHQSGHHLGNFLGPVVRVHVDGQTVV